MNKVLILLFTFSITAFGQNSMSIFGIIQTESQKPASNVNVILVDTQKGTITDFDGNFNINNVNLDSGLLKISGLGYESKEVSFNFNGREKLQLNIKINEATEALNEVIVDTEASKVAKKLR